MLGGSVGIFTEELTAVRMQFVSFFEASTVASHQSGKSDDGQTIILLRDWYLRYSMD